MDALAKPILSVFGITFVTLAIMLIFALKIDQNTQTYCSNAAEEFIDDASVAGYISPGNYQVMMDRISNTGNIYEVNILHQSAMLAPMVDEAGVTHVGSYVSTYNTYTKSEILQYMFPATGTEYKNYPLKNGDYLKITITLKEPTWSAKLASMVTGKPVKTIGFTYGSYVGSHEDNGITF